MAPASLVVEAARYVAIMTGHDGWRFEARGKVDGEDWAWTPTGEAPAQDPVVDYEIDIVATTTNGQTGTVFVSSGQEIEDDGSPVAGHASVEVVAHRTQTSTVVGMAVGPDEIDQVLELFTVGDVDAPTPEVAVSSLGKKLGISHLAL